MRNHLHGTLAIDFVTVPTVRFEVLYVFVVLSLERRCILHVNVRLTLRSLRSPLEARQGVLHRTLTSYPHVTTEGLVDGADAYFRTSAASPRRRSCSSLGHPTFA